MGITERRARERVRRQEDILAAAWAVAEEVGWATFSVERVAAKAELGRATVYGYFESLDALIEAMAEAALTTFAKRVADAKSMGESLDAPLRFSQGSPAAFALLFQQGAVDARPAFSNERLERVRADARQIVGALHRRMSRAGGALPADAADAQAFLAGIAMAGATVPELRSSTPLRRRWQSFALGVEPAGTDEAGGPAQPTGGGRRVPPR